MPNIDADEFVYLNNDVEDTRTFSWKKKGVVVHELTVTTWQLLDCAPSPCPACLMFRGELVRMEEVRENRKLLHYKCPKCHGRQNLDQHLICTCGEIPHKISCHMGFGNYFPGV